MKIMGMSFSNTNVKIIILKWDQKLGGVLEYQYPKFEFPDNQCMNIYNMHRMRSKAPGYGNLSIKLDNGTAYSCVTFYSGFGEGGFGANYGEHVIGISERVIALFLDKGLNPSDYEEILACIAAYILMDSENIGTRLEKIGAFINSTRLLSKPKELYSKLSSELPKELDLTSDQQIIMKDLELKANKARINDLKDRVQELRINPAKNAYCEESDRMIEYEKRIKALNMQIAALTAQKQMSESIVAQKEDLLQQLRNDYVATFGTLTNQINLLENELMQIKESTQGLVNDLNSVLAEKIAKNEALKKELQDMKIMLQAPEQS